MAERNSTPDHSPATVKTFIPTRIQRSRRKGWTLPANTVVVTRPTSFGNPFAVGRHYRRDGGGIPRLGLQFVFTEAFEGFQDATYTTIKTSAEAVDWFRWYASTWTPARKAMVAHALRGKNLACWCRIGEPCHADVLLEIANQSSALSPQPPTKEQQ